MIPEHQRDAWEANRRWDFVAIQPFSIDTLAAPVEKMIKAGVPVIDMDTLIAPLEQIDVHSFLAPDNEFMGAAVTQVLMDQIGGEKGGRWRKGCPRLVFRLDQDEQQP